MVFGFMRKKKHGSDASPDGSSESETDSALIDDIVELREEVRKKKDTLRGTDAEKKESIKELEKMSKDQMKAERDKLQTLLEELRKEEIRSRRASFENSPGRRSLSVPSLGSNAFETTKSMEDEFHYCALLDKDKHYGLNWDDRFSGKPNGPPDEKRRRDRREGTKRKVATELKIEHFGKEAALGTWFKDVGQETTLFLDTSPAAQLGEAPAGGSYLLGRYDVVVTRVWADLDRNWDFIKKKNRFWVAHAAAINIGESVEATDFNDFCEGQNSAGAVLSEELYLEAMGHIMQNLTYAANQTGVEHFVFFPFGMGAFIRHVNKLDGRYEMWEETQRLRRRLAREFVKVASQTLNGNARFHLCLGFGNEDSEPRWNSDAFLRALLAEDEPSIKDFRSRVTIHEEGDCLQLAQELGEHSNNVMLVNGANRSLLGNHWFNGYAKMAIDENLHRRSWRMAATSYLLNNYGRHREPRRQDQLAQNVEAIGGTVHKIRR